MRCRGVVPELPPNHHGSRRGVGDFQPTRIDELLFMLKYVTPNSRAVTTSSNPKAFTRDATGLVRSLGFFDQFVIALSVTQVMVGFVLTALYAPYFFPGANLALVFLIGSIPAFAMAYIYSKMSYAIARTGGDYISSTRILGPIYGSVQLVFFTGPLVILGAAVSAYFLVTLGLSQLFFALGASTNNAGILSLGRTVTTPAVGFAISFAVTIVMTLVAMSGIHVFAWVIRVVVIASLAIVLIFIAILATLNSAALPGVFDHAMQLAGSNTTYSAVIQSGSSAGLSTGGFSLSQTLLAAIPWGFLTFGGFNWGVYLVGETKSPGKSITRALFLCITVVVIGLIVMTELAYRYFGSLFMNSASYVLANNPSAMPTLPTMAVLVSLSNPAYAAIFEGGIVLAFLGLVLVNIVALSRLFFAASFDRLLPSKLADTYERLHSPYLSIILVAVINLAYVTLLWFGGFATSI